MDYHKLATQADKNNINRYTCNGKSITYNKIKNKLKDYGKT